MTPNLFILGAPKCGTTSLYDWLAQTDAVAAPRDKEPHYYYNPYGGQVNETAYKSRYEYSEQDYRYCLDGSVWYLFSETAAKRIIREVPHAKFIVCLRNPIELAPSLHFQKIFTGHESVKIFSEAWDLNDKRAQGEFSGITGLPKDADPRHMAYREACLLGRQVQTLLRQVPRERIFFVFLEDMSSEPAAMYKDLCEFLGVPPAAINFSIKNRAKKSRANWFITGLEWLKAAKCALGIKAKTGAFASLHRLNRVEVRYQDVDKTLRNKMVKSFEQDIKLIEDITERDLSSWTCKKTHVD